MKRNKCWLFLLGLVIFMLTACSEQITQGEVVKKDFTPAHSQVIIVPIVHSIGNSTYTTPMPFVYYYSDKYTITIEKWDKEEGKLRQAIYRVDKETYDIVNIGDEFSYEKDMEPNEPEYTREQQHS